MLLDLREVKTVKLGNQHQFTSIYYGDKFLWGQDLSIKSDFTTYRLTTTVTNTTNTLLQVTLDNRVPLSLPSNERLTDWGDGTVDNKTTHSYDKSFLLSTNSIYINTHYKIRVIGGNGISVKTHLLAITKYITDFVGLFSYHPEFTCEENILQTISTTTIERMFYCSKLQTKLIIPSNITNISYAFFETNTNDVSIIPATVTNCSFAFAGSYSRPYKTLPQENIDLIENHHKDLNHEGCYRLCTNLITPPYDTIPSDWK